MASIKRLFSFKGRIRRREFGLTFIVCEAIAIVFAIVAFCLGDYFLAMEEQGEEISKEFTIAILVFMCLVFIVLCVGFIWICIAQGAKRCHDRGNSGWYQFIPYYFLWQFFADGCPYTNKYGPDPKGREESVQEFDKCIYLWVVAGIMLFFYSFYILPEYIKDYKIANPSPINDTQLPENEMSNGIIIVTLPKNCKGLEYFRRVQEDYVNVIQINDEENPNYYILVVTTDYDTINDATFRDAWKSTCLDAIGGLLYETVEEKSWREGDKRFWNKAVRCKAEIPFIWSFTMIIDSETQKSCAVSAKYVEENKVPLQEIIKGIRFKQ